MSYVTRIGTAMDDDFEDFSSGRLESQKRQALDAKKVRTYIIQHPGCTQSQISKGTGVTKIEDAIEWLIMRGFIASNQGGFQAIPI
jgi:hypothetical protein